jgi:hypothetical protein
MNAPQQCYGTIIQCLYTARLSGKVKCGSDATCSVPVFIYKPQTVAATATPAYPPDWNPVVFDQLHVSTNGSAFNLPPPMTIDQYPDWHTMKPSAPAADNEFPVLSDQAMHGAVIRTDINH